MASATATLSPPVVIGLQKHYQSRIADLCSALESYLPRSEIQKVYRAYLFSAEAHEGQFRKAGEPYIFHPVAVACILAEMHLDYKCLIAALLHDVIEDTGVIKEALAREFDPEIAELVDGVSKLAQIDFKDKAEAQAANVSKMLLAMTRDIRVILIKLADRLHNMRTLGVFSIEKNRRIAKETLDIYAPIANRLGINNVCLELEDLGFRHYWPSRYYRLKKAVERTCTSRADFIASIENTIRERLHQNIITGLVTSRQKHLYGIYRKMMDKQCLLSEIVDVYGMRIIVDKIDTCYRSLGLVHDLYKPVHGRFKDYIALPKANGYQSLHTLVVGPGGVKVEVQIRTEEMHKIAESGIAAHWIYKSPNSSPSKVHTNWQQNLLEMKQGSRNLVEFLENVKVDLFPEEVCVFTPRGKIIVLPQKATALDFAYAIHSDLGNTCSAIKIDHRLIPLRTQLQSGQTVEIITKPEATPKASWLNFLVTSKARASVRQYLKHQESLKANELGRTLIENELKLLDITLEQVPSERLRNVLDNIKAATIDDMYHQVGIGHVLPRIIAWQLKGKTAPPPDELASGRLVIKGSTGVAVSFGKCCHPIFGDHIIGTFNPGRGLVIHRYGCHSNNDNKRPGHTWLDVEWDNQAEIDLPTEILVEMGNKRGILATVATTIADAGSNIEKFHFIERDDGLSAAISLMVTVRGLQHLADIIRHLQAVPDVINAVRVYN